ncbi:alpha-fucosidase [Candidatus Poribacteria bacterium]|nr:alpha-fucosidase [Candidatus Poribacteria bacterium]
MLAKPTPQQLEWQESELTMFLHFGVNTFTDREWGDGTEDPMIFNPTELDTDQWVEVAKDAGFKYMIITAKHHDGFCLFPSKYTEHSVKNSPWKDGKGDVVKELAQSCRKRDMKLGIYLSPWDRHEKTYGDSPAYNQYFRNQLTELLTNYGEISEVWFDGACGEGPNGKRQEYDWQSYYQVIRDLQPDALIAICGPDIRWVGNEDGIARETEWSVQEASPERHPDTKGKIWYPAECDVSIRPGWFWHASQDSKVKPLEHLIDIYYKSVGRNSVLLLNVPPNDKGLFADPDVQRLKEFRSVLDQTFDVNFAEGKAVQASSAHPEHPASNSVDGNGNTFWMTAQNPPGGTIEIDLGEPVIFNIAMVKEYISLSQRVESYSWEIWKDGNWIKLAEGTTIGHKKLDRFTDVTTNKVRLNIIKSLATPLIRYVGLYKAPLI